MELTELSGVGPVRAESLRAMGIVSLRDLLYDLPLRYEDHETVFPCCTRQEGMVMVQGTLASRPVLSFFHGLKKLSATLEDATGKLSVCWYNMPWLASQLKEGQRISLYGRLSGKKNRLTLQNPRIILSDEKLVPVYRTNKKIPSAFLRKLISAALEQVDTCCPEFLPSAFRRRYQLCELSDAIRQVHSPDSLDSLKIARRRLAFQQILLYLIYVTMSGAVRQPGYPFRFDHQQVQYFWNALPFTPTGSQIRVLDDIASDLQSDQSMSRLVQGDVGCGKTAVAFGALWLTFISGYQAAMMAPTEILAVQHYENAVSTLGPLGVKCRLLTGSTKAKERKEILQELETGRCDALFGTHALISQDVHYHRLGLVITDEQHRFGVNQRSNLQLKGKLASRVPHVLVMSATPIPRTLALILYGDLDLSVINELPEGRKPVKTRLVPEEKRKDMYAFLRNEINHSRQAYIVCPLVEEDDQLELHSAKALCEQLRKNELSGLRIGLTWGSQNASEKDRVLHDFSSGLYDVLVSTTVIEVGVNNPNATIMIIENAERYGLSQLHQLRGRVGRGSAESWCFLLAKPSEKLNLFCSTNDGFVIAQKDLEIRGPGELAGTRQSGIAGNSFLYADVALLEEVSQCVRELHLDPLRKEELETIEDVAREYFAGENLRIALN